jgi:hypothetical protein
MIDAHHDLGHTDVVHIEGLVAILGDDALAGLFIKQFIK